MHKCMRDVSMHTRQLNATRLDFEECTFQTSALSRLCSTAGGRITKYAAKHKIKTQTIVGIALCLAPPFLLSRRSRSTIKWISSEGTRITQYQRCIPSLKVSSSKSNGVTIRSMPRSRGIVSRAKNRVAIKIGMAVLVSSLSILASSCTSTALDGFSES